MEKEQRKVYDVFKEKIKENIMKEISKNGIGKSGILILDGLLKLRQICNSPALINSKEDYGNDSVKIRELIRNLMEKTGNHKVLVFSQFVGMLGLVKKELEINNIGYCYLDGQSRKRQEIVETFVKDERKRVFLISIKAGVSASI